MTGMIKVKPYIINPIKNNKQKLQSICKLLFTLLLIYEYANLCSNNGDPSVISKSPYCKVTVNSAISY